MENGIHWTTIVGDVVSGWLVLSSKFRFVCLTCLCFAFRIHQTFVWGHSSVTCCLLLCRWRFLYISEFILRVLKYYETRIGLEWEPCKISFGKGLEPHEQTSSSSWSFSSSFSSSSSSSYTPLKRTAKTPCWLHPVKRSWASFLQPIIFLSGWSLDPCPIPRHPSTSWGSMF